MLSGKPNPTVRDFVHFSGRGTIKEFPNFVGTPSEVADQMEEWFTGRACDDVLAATHTPGAFEDFTRFVVPELQRRGLAHHKDYAGPTLRESRHRPPECAATGARFPEDGMTISLARRAVLGAGLAYPHGGARPGDVWPSRTVRIIVPYAPGGGTDVTTRSIRRTAYRALRPQLRGGRAGANGIVGTEAVARSAPDGYTFGAQTATHIMARQMGRCPMIRWRISP